MCLSKGLLLASSLQPQRQYLTAGMPMLCEGCVKGVTCMAASASASCARMRASLPARPPKRPHGSFDSAAASLSSAAVALECVPSLLMYVVSLSSEESESDPSACGTVAGRRLAPHPKLSSILCNITET